MQTENQITANRTCCICSPVHLCVLRDLEEALEMGVDWSLREGYAWAEDKEHCEEYGRMLQADPNKVSSKAKKRGLPQVSQQPFLHLLARCDAASSL